MDIKQAIELIENTEVSDQLREAREAIKQNLARLNKDDYEEISKHYYYLLRITLKMHNIFETETAKFLYRKLVKNLALREQGYLDALKDTNRKEIVKLQLGVFYQMAIRYFSTLEVIYDKLDFLQAKQRSFEEKMRYRQNNYLIRRDYWQFFGFKFLQVSSNYGTSFVRWGITSLVFMVLFAGLFWLLSIITDGQSITASGIYDYFHFSVATFTTLGYGDITPVSLAGKILANIEVFAGFIMLGLLIGMVQKKLP
jgi:ABC-type multidrug transport system fused ATPase/permease subunit